MLGRATQTEKTVFSIQYVFSALEKSLKIHQLKDDWQFDFVLQMVNLRMNNELYDKSVQAMSKRESKLQEYRRRRLLSLDDGATF